MKNYFCQIFVTPTAFSFRPGTRPRKRNAYGVYSIDSMSIVKSLPSKIIDREDCASAMVPVVLTVAGSDSGGGAGIQADLKTFSALGVFGTSAITALTAQNTRGVSGIHKVPSTFLKKQLQAVLEDFPVQVIKTGMLPDVEVNRQCYFRYKMYHL